METSEKLDKLSKEGSSIEEIPENDLNFINDHLSFLEWATKDKRIQVIREQSPILDSYFISDISLYKKGPLEDKIYTRRDDYYNNIERGKAFIEILQENQKQHETNIMLIKRGFKKFYDLHPLHILYNLDNKNEIKLDHHSAKVYERIFHNVKHFFQAKNGEEEINLFKIYKENGEHCQISYCKSIDSWIIGSKNVSIVINNLQELEKYLKDRHRWPKLIAETWFSMLSDLSSQQINDLKEELNGRTILGEHCGHPMHQHIMKYSKIQIIFYALIENEDKEICADPDIAYSFFQRFKLEMSKRIKFDNIKTFEEMNNVLFDMSKKIAAAPMEEEGEGSVIYFTSLNKKTGKRKMLGMCKIKSYDYCAFRELREKLKKFILKNYEERTYVKKYCFEIEKLCQYFDAHKSVEFYSNLCRNSFHIVKNEKEKYDFNYIYYRFVDFLHEIIKKTSENTELHSNLEDKSTNKIEKKIQIILITPPCFISNDELKNLCESLNIPSIQYNWREEKPLEKSRNLYQNFITPKLSGQKLPDSTYFLIAGFDTKSLSESQFNLENMDEKRKNLNPGEASFATSKNIPQKLSLFAKNVDIFKNSLLKDYKENLICCEDSKSSSLQTIKEIFQRNKETIKQEIKIDFNQISENNELIVIIPMGIPGMGKSTVERRMQKLVEEIGINFYSLSSDEIRRKEFDDYEKINVILNYNRNEVYKATSKVSSQKFFEGIKDILKKIGNEKNEKCKKNLFFLDKNHTPNIIGATTNFLKSNCPKNINMKIIALLPNCSDNYFKHGEHLNNEYPFSAQFFFICLKRCLNRETHETLTGDALHIFQVVLKFFNIFRGFKFKANTLKVYDIDNYTYLDFHVESENFYKTVSSTLIKSLAKCLETFTPGYDAENSPILQDFLDEFYKTQIEEKEIDSNKIEDQIRKRIVQLFKFE